MTNPPGLVYSRDMETNMYQYTVFYPNYDKTYVYIIDHSNQEELDNVLTPLLKNAAMGEAVLLKFEKYETDVDCSTH